MSDLFKTATRLGFRFPTPQGDMTVEDLWRLPLRAPTGRANLDDIARAFHKKLNNAENVSFVDKEKKSDPTIQMKFDLVREIIEDRLAEQQKANDEKAQKDRTQKILGIIAEKRDADLKNMTVEELEKLLAQ